MTIFIKQAIRSWISHLSDPLFYCYTSGTTGLPKAAVIKHSRIFYADLGMKIPGKITDKDTVYCPLPSYHMIGVMSLTFPLFSGCSTFIRHKFSASKYWKEFHEKNCTVSVKKGSQVPKDSFKIWILLKCEFTHLITLLKGRSFHWGIVQILTRSAAKPNGRP